jgi:hypothetical protein
MGFNFSIVFIWLGIFLFSVGSLFSGTRTLAPGWNLVSIPVSSATSVVTYLQSNLTGNLTKAWTFDGVWKKYVPGASNSDTGTEGTEFNQFQQNRGYWFLMDASGGALTYNDSETPQALALDKNGWALVSFNQTSNLDIASQVLSASNFDAGHSPSNITKVWEFGPPWSFYADSDSNSSLSTIRPGYAYWFLVTDQTNQLVSESSRMTITPTGASATDNAVLVLGGATTLVPPDANQAANIMGRPRSFAKYSTSRFASTASASHTTAHTDTMSCDTAQDEGKVVGWAHLFSVEGDKLTTSMELHCSSDPTAPLTFEFRLTKEEVERIREENVSCVTTIDLNSGQSEKALVPNTPMAMLPADLDDLTSPMSLNNDTSSTSTLGVAMAGQELAGKLGLSPDQFVLGSLHSGLEETNSDIRSKTSTSSDDGFDLHEFDRFVRDGASDSDSLFNTLKDQIDSVNRADKLTETGRVSDRADEITRLLNGESKDSDTQSFKDKLDHARQVSSQGQELQQARRNALRRGIIDKGTGDDEHGKLDDLLAKMLKIREGDENLLDAGDALTRSLGMAVATSGDATLESLTRSKATSIIFSVNSSLGSLDTSTGTTKVMEIIGEALEYSDATVALMAKNSSAAREFAGIVGQGTKILKRAESEDNSASTSDRKLDKLGALTSKLGEGINFLTTLAKNADDNDAVSEILAEAVGSSADSTAAADAIFAEIAEAKTLIESSTDLQVDFSDMMKKSKGRGHDLRKLGRIIARNAGDANEAAEVLAELAGAVTTDVLNDVLQDETLNQEFSLNSKIFADAGPDRKRRFDGATTDLKLDARGSFDPSGSTLYFQWFEVSSAGVASSIHSTRTSAGQDLVTHAVATTGTDLIEKAYRVEVSDGLGASAKVGRAEFRAFLFPQLPPVIELPRFITGRVGQPIYLDASRSFDPEGQANLSFSWTFSGNPTLQPDAVSPEIEITYAEPGRYAGVLSVNKLEGTSVVATTTRAIRIKVNGVLAPIADAGFPLILEQAEVLDAVNFQGGIFMENFSFSLETGDDSGLTYLWEPAVYFSTNAGVDATSRHPLLTLTAPGKYTLTLTVADQNAGGQSATDEVFVAIRRGRPPFADAGHLRVVRLGASSQVITLDGSASFSFVTETPDYQWSGPTSFVGSTDKSADAEIELDPNQFSSKTKLRYTLNVADDNGTSSDHVDVVVIPSIRPPVALLEFFPHRRSYRSGAEVILEQFSFSPDDLDVTVSWTFLGNIQLLTGTQGDDGTGGSDSITIRLPQVSADTKVKVQLTATDSNGKTDSQEVVFRVEPDSRPPVAIAEPNFIILEAGDQSNPVLISGADSFSRSDAEIGFEWTFDTSKISIASGDLSSSTLSIYATSGTAKGFENITLTVTDPNGLSDTRTIVARIRESAGAAKPIFLDGKIEERFDFQTRRFKPKFVPGAVFANGETYIYPEPGVFVYGIDDVVRGAGFGYDPNSNATSFGVTATIYSWNPSSETTVAFIETLTQATSDNSGFLDFSFESSPQTSSATWFALRIAADEGGSREHIELMPYRVRGATATAQPVAKPIIAFVETPSTGLTEINTDSDFSGVFPDDEVFVAIQGFESSNPNGGELNYSWSAEFEGSIRERKGAPNLFLIGKDGPELNFVWPLQAQKRTLAIKLVVKDEFSGTPSKTKTVRLTLSQARRIPPIAIAGDYPEFLIPAADTNISVTLDGGSSFSPVGNALNFNWEYLGGDTNPFGGSSDSATGVTPALTLSKGIHPFRLTVTDASDADLTDSKFFRIEVKKERKIAAGINFGIEGFVDAFPVDALVGDSVSIESKVFAFPANPGAVPDFSKLVQTIKIHKRGNAGNLHTDITEDSVGNNQRTTVFDTPGEYVVIFEAWHDTNDNDAFNPADSSGKFDRRFIIRVNEEIDPVHARIDMDAQKIRQTSSGSATVPLTFVIENPNDPNNTSGTWTYFYRWELKNTSDFQRSPYTLTYDDSTGNSATSTPSNGRNKIEGSSSNTVDLSLTGLADGEYFMELEILAENANGIRQHGFAETFFRLVSSQVRVIVNVFDPDDSLDFNSLSVDVFAIASQSLDLAGSKIQDIQSDKFSIIEDGKGRAFSFTLTSPLDFSTATHNTPEFTVTGRHEITGLLIKASDIGIDGNAKLRILEFRDNVPGDGEWYIDIINRADNTEIDGNFIAVDSFFSFENDEVFTEVENENGAERKDIDFSVGEEEIFEFDSASTNVTGFATEVTRVFFSAGDDRRIVPVAPFSSDGTDISPEDFFDLALSSGANIDFPHEIFENSISGAIFAKAGQLFLVGYPKGDGTGGAALMLITYSDEYGFAFRYAKATKVIPNISFGGGVVKDQVHLSMNFETGDFFAEGGLPGSEFVIITSSNKGHQVSGTGTDLPTTSCAKTNRVTALYSFTETCVGRFNPDGTVDGYVEFLDEFFPEPGDSIDIVGYRYTTLQGDERSIELPNPLRFFLREDKFGGFGLAFLKVTADNEFQMAYFGEPDMDTATNPANYMIKTSDTFNKLLFKEMRSGGDSNGVSITAIVDMPAMQPELSGWLKFTLSSPYLNSTSKYLALSATRDVLSMQGEPVERRKHVAMRDIVWNNIVEAPHKDTKWLEVREDDYGFRSQPYLKAGTTHVINGTEIRFEEGNPFGEFRDYREFLALDYNNGMQYLGVGNFDGQRGVREFWDIPQAEIGFNSFTNTAPRTPVVIIPIGAGIGDTVTGTYRSGNSFNAGVEGGEFGTDFRPRVEWSATILRARPVKDIGDHQFMRAVEVRVVEEWHWPFYNESGILSGFDQQNFEQRIRRFWFADKLGIVFMERENRFISADQGNAIEHGFRDKSRIVAYKRGDNGVIFVGEGDARLIDPNFTNFTTVDMRVELGFGDVGANYKLVVKRPSEGQEGQALDSAVEAQLLDPNLPNFENRLPDRFASVEFSVVPTSFAPFIFEVYRWPDSVANNPGSTAGDVPETDGNLVGEVSLFLKGEHDFENIFIELRGEDDVPAVMVFDHSGYSFLGGQFTGPDDAKRDFAYLPDDRGNGLVMVLNPRLPNSDIKSNRRIKEVFLEGSDLKDQFERVLSGQSTINTTGMANAGDRMELQPGKAYLYTGPGIDTMKGVGQDRVLVLLAVVSRDDHSVGFVYVMKGIGDLPQFASFEGVQLNNHFGFQIHENFYEDSVTIRGFSEYEGEGTHLVDFNLVGSHEDVRQALLNDATSDDPNVDPDLVLTIVEPTDGDSYYSLAASVGSSMGLTGIRKLNKRIDLFSLPSALPTTLDDFSETVMDGTTYIRGNTFLGADKDGNHILFVVDSFDVFPDEFHALQEQGINADPATLGITPERRYFLEYIYLLDTDASNVVRYFAYIDQQTGNLVTEMDNRPMAHHDIMLDFNLTGRPFQPVTDSANALLQIEGDRFAGNYRVFAADPSQTDLLRGAIVFAKFEFDEGVQNIEIDRYDGQGHTVVEKGDAAEGVELGEIDFGGFRDGNIQFHFADDVERHNGDRVTITELLWELPGSATVLSTSVNIPFEFSTEPVGGNQPAPGDGFQAIGAKTGMDGDFAYLDIWFTQDIDPESQEFPYLIRLEQHFDKPDDNGTAGDPNDPSGTAANQGFIEFRPIELLHDSTMPNKLRAYFSRAATPSVVATNTRFSMIIDADFGGQVPKGIRNTDGELLHFAFLNIGNAPIFQSGDFFPFDSSFSFVYNRFSDGQSTTSTPLSPVVTASLETSGGTSNLTDIRNGTMIRRFNVIGSAFEYCGDDSIAASPCVTLWWWESTLGSVISLGNGNFVRVAEFMDTFYAGGLDYQNAVVLEWINRNGSNIEKTHMVFARGIGLVQHFTDIINSETFDFKGFSGLELMGYKHRSVQRGNLDGLSGIEFTGIEVSMSFIVPDGENQLALDEGRSPYSMTFFQRNQVTGFESPLRYSLNGGAETTAPLEDIFPGSDKVYELFFPKANTTNRDGILPFQGGYNIIARLTDGRKDGERNVDLSTSMTFFYWFIDFAQEGGEGSPQFRSGELGSLLLNDRLGPGDPSWDLRVEKDETDPNQPMINIILQGARESGGNSNRLMRRVEDEFGFGDARSLPGAAITTNGLPHQQSTTDLTLVNEELVAHPGSLYLIKIPQADRQRVIGGSPANDIYALVLVKDVNPFDGFVEADYLLSSDVGPDGVNFFDRPVNDHDPEFFKDEGPKNEVPRRGLWMRMREGICVDMEVDPFDFVSGVWDENRPGDVCAADNSTAELSVDRFRAVTDDRFSDINSSHGLVELVITVPGGYEPAALRTWEHKDLPFAVHPSMLANQSSATTIAVSIPFSIFFNQDGGEPRCDGGMPWIERSYYGREDLSDGNDFIFQYGIWLDLHGDSDLSSTNTAGTGVATPLPAPTSLADCVARAKPVMDFQYDYYAAARFLPDLPAIPHRGDFSGTGRIHPLAPMGQIQDLLDYQTDASNPDNDLILGWKMAAMTVNPSMIATFAEPCHDRPNDPNCQGTQRFRLETQDQRFEFWGSRVDFHVAGFDANHPLNFVVEANSPTSYRQRQVTTAMADFRMGLLRSPFGADATATGNTAGTGQEPLHINFGPQWSPFQSMTVDRLYLSLPLSRIVTSTPTDVVLNFKNDGGRFEAPAFHVDFDPSTQSAAFTPTELNASYHTLTVEGEAELLELLTTAGSNPLTGTWIFFGSDQTSETGPFELAGDGSILARTPEGDETVYKVGSGFTIPQLNGQDIPGVILVMLKTDDPNKFEPELWFPNSGDRDSFRDNKLFEQLFGGGGSQGGGGQTNPSPSIDLIEEEFRVIGVDAGISPGDALKIRFSHPLPMEAGPMFMPADPTTFISISNEEDLTGVFGPGKFLIFKDLSFADTFRIFDWEPSGPSSIATFGTLITDISPKIVDLGDTTNINSDFWVESAGSATEMTHYDTIEVHDIGVASNTDFDAAAGHNYFIWVSPFMSLPDDDAGSSAGASQPTSDDEGPEWLFGAHGFGKGINMALYSQDFTNPDHFLRQVDIQGDFSSHFTADRTKMSVNVTEQATHITFRTIQTPTVDFLADNGFNAQTVELGFGGSIFASLNPQMLYLQEEEVELGQNPRLEDYTSLWRLPNSGALFFIADYEFAHGNRPAEFSGAHGRADRVGVAADSKFSIPIFANLDDLANGTDTAGAMMKVGQVTRHTWIDDASQKDATAATGGWRGWKNRITVEVLALMGTMSLEAHGSTTAVSDVLALRFTSTGYPVIGDSASGPWWRDDKSPAGELDEEILFFSPGRGLFMDTEWSEEIQPYCVDAGDSHWIFEPDDQSNCDSDGVKFQTHEWESTFASTAFEGFNEHLLPPPPPGTITFTVGNNGSADYTISSDNGLATTNDPALTLRRGSTYDFDINTLGHPFRIASDSGPNGGAQYNDGVTGASSNINLETGILTFQVPANAPDTLYYYCVNHPSTMFGTLNIVN